MGSTPSGLTKKTQKSILAIKVQGSTRPQIPLVIDCLLLEPEDVSMLVTHGNPRNTMWPLTRQGGLAARLILLAASSLCLHWTALGRLK